jgi:hypothetical protein
MSQINLYYSLAENLKIKSCLEKMIRINNLLPFKLGWADFKYFGMSKDIHAVCRAIVSAYPIMDEHYNRGAGGPPFFETSESILINTFTECLPIIAKLDDKVEKRIISFFKIHEFKREFTIKKHKPIIKEEERSIELISSNNKFYVRCRINIADIDACIDNLSQNGLRYVCWDYPTEHPFASFNKLSLDYITKPLEAKYKLPFSFKKRSKDIVKGNDLLGIFNKHCLSNNYKQIVHSSFVVDGGVSYLKQTAKLNYYELVFNPFKINRVTFYYHCGQSYLIKQQFSYFKDINFSKYLATIEDFISAIMQKEEEICKKVGIIDPNLTKLYYI